MSRNSLLQIVLVVTLILALFLLPLPISQATKLASNENRSISLNGAHVRYSSPVLADLNSDSKPDIIVGGSDGRIHVYEQDGTKLWEYDTGEDAAIESSPAVSDIDGDGNMEVVFGAGSTFTPSAHGGLYAIDTNGSLLWQFNTGDYNSDGWRDGVYSTPALGDIDGDGKLEIIFGAWDAYVRALNGEDGSILWETFVRDSVWSSPVLGDIDRDGYLDVAIGVDAHDESAFGTPNGGSLHVFTGDGAEMAGFPQHVDEVIYSSPALGDLDDDGWLDIVVGTGGYFGRGKQVHAWDHSGSYLSGWPRSTGDYCFSSPAMGDIDSDGALEAIIGCNDGRIYAWDGNGSQKFATQVKDRYGNSSWGVGSSPILADIDADGMPEILFSYNWDVGVLESNGSQSSAFYETSYTVSNSPAVGDIDNDGKLEVVVAGGSGASQGMIYIWDLNVTSDANPWPMFHRDAAHNGHVPVAPILSASPASLDFMHQTGDPTQPTLPVHLTNNGDCAVNWTASAPGGLHLTPASGTIEPTVTDYDDINVTVLNPTSYTPDTTQHLGSVTINGTASCGTVDACSVAVTFYASDFSRIYLPVAMRQYVPVLYSDDFSDPTSGWPIGEDGETGNGYFGLEYGVHISKIDQNIPRATARGPFSVSGDYAIQVEARGTTMAFARCGIIFNASADMSRYDYFFIDNRYPTDPLQGSNLRRYESGSYKRLKAKPVSGTVVELYEPNVLRVEVVGSEIRAFVDGIQILSYNDSNPPGGGYIGLYAEHAYYGDPAEAHWDQYHKANCHFDNLLVTRP